MREQGLGSAIAASGSATSGASVRIRLPDERLRPFVTFFYFVEVAEALDDFLYPEWGNVRFGTGGEWRFIGENYPPGPMGDACLFGPTDRAIRIVSLTGRTTGFGLTPLGWERLVGRPADAAANGVEEVGDLLGEPSATVRAALLAHCSDDESHAFLEALLLRRIEQAPLNSCRAITVDRVLRERPADVEAFVAAAGLPRKTLSRVCREVFGFGPKRLLRRQRFLDTLGKIRITERPHLTMLIDPAYVDQSHFNHEFREFMGLSPRAYLSAPRPLMGQAALAQIAAGVPLSFKLPPQEG